MSFQGQSNNRHPAEIVNGSKSFARSKEAAQMVTVGAAVALMVGFVVPASALSLGSPQDVRPGATPPVELARPASLIRSTRPQQTPTIGTRQPGKLTAKPATGISEQPAKRSGPLSIMISLNRQQLTLYSGTEPIAHSRVSSGVAGRSTPTGVFSIIQKDRFHRSNLYDDAPMYFMQRITWSGVALHQGIVPNYPASHGCVRLPEAFAKQLWGTTRLGVRVIISHDDVAPHEFAHDKLFTPKPEQVASAPNSVQAAQQAWKIAQLGGTVPMMGATANDVVTQPTLDVLPKPAARPTKQSPISVFISRKEGKVFVRKDLAPLFDSPVTIDRPDLALGTHVFTAIARKDDGALRWTVVSMPSKAASAVSAPGAGSALDRITIPQETLDRISELTTSGASLIISDQGLGTETGLGTDFIVLTR